MHAISPIAISWRIFAAPEIPEGMVEGRPPLGKTLALPDGRAIAARDICLPAGEVVNLDEQLLPERLPVLTRCLLVGDCEVPEEGAKVIGVSIDWKWALFVNGELCLDARVCSNGEHPCRPDDHLARCRLRRGHNQIVCECRRGEEFQAAVTLYEDIPRRLKGRPLAHFPDASCNAMSITFTLDDIAPAGVRFRKAGTEEWRRAYHVIGGQIRRDTALHHLRLTGLEANADYEYQPFYLDEPSGWGERELGAVERFRTLPAPGTDFSFVATADAQDLRTRASWLDTLFQRDYARDASFFAYVGDVYWTSDFEKAVLEEFIAPYQKATGNRLALEFVRGNHEYYGREAQRFFAYFSAPANGSQGYSLFRCGDVCFIVLDFGDDDGPRPYPSTRALYSIDGYLEEQARWLDSVVDLPICREARYRIVLAHALPFGDWHAYLPGKVRRVIDSFFAGDHPRCPIHLWLGGHVHYPLRTIPGSNAFRSTLAPRWPSPEEKEAMRRAGLLQAAQYGFPIVVFSGPSARNAPELQMSDVAVAVSQEGLTVVSHDRNGVAYDCIFITPDRRTTELFCADGFQRMALDGDGNGEESAK